MNEKYLIFNKLLISEIVNKFNYFNLVKICFFGLALKYEDIYN